MKQHFIIFYFRQWENNDIESIAFRQKKKWAKGAILNEHFALWKAK